MATGVWDATEAAKWLDDSRRAWNDPDKILQYMNLGQCSVFCEIGCGNGWFTLEAAQKGPRVVLAVDLCQEALDELIARAKAEGLDHIKPVLAEAIDEFPIPTDSVDVVLLANTYSQIDPASNFLHEVRRLLKPGSTVLVVDWKKEGTGDLGPPLEQRVDQQDVVDEFSFAGYILFGTCDVGPYHYGLKFYNRQGDEPHTTQNQNVP
jgi:SAM-dependent methyltransferase